MPEIDGRRPPNIILIITDQQRFDTIAAHGYDYMDTPHLDRLVNEGVSFSRCFVNAPSCGPSRASLFTGYTPHNSGALRNNAPWPRTWVHDLRAAGYHCVNLGKMHAEPYEGMHGFHERQVVENKQRRFAEPLWTGNPHPFNDEWDKALQRRGLRRLEKEDFIHREHRFEELGAYDWWYDNDLHPDTFVGDMALNWLEQALPTDDQPFFLEIGFPGPHPPFDPPRSYAEPYLEKDLPMLPATDAEMDTQPRGIRALRDRLIERFADSIAFDPHASDKNRQRQRAYYFGNITLIDEKVGQIMAAMKERGDLENAVVIFTSDHGELLGDHGLIEKWNMYEYAVRVPLIVWSPDRYDANRTIDSLVQWFDIGPTILELAGVEPPSTFEALSFLPLLENDPIASGREYIFSEHAPDPVLNTIQYMLMIRNQRWKLVEFVGETEGQLFDLEADPDELHDLWDDPGHANIKADLKTQLHDWFVTSTASATPWRNPVRYE